MDPMGSREKGLRPNYGATSVATSPLPATAATVDAFRFQW